MNTVSLILVASILGLAGCSRPHPENSEVPSYWGSQADLARKHPNWKLRNAEKIEIDGVTQKKIDSVVQDLERRLHVQFGAMVVSRVKGDDPVLIVFLEDQKALRDGRWLRVRDACVLLYFNEGSGSVVFAHAATL